MTIRRAIILVLVAGGFALGGKIAGSAVFAAIFETLRAHDMDAPLNSPAVLAAFELAGMTAGFLLGAALALRWLRREPEAPTPLFVVYLAAALGGAGGFALAHVIDFGGLAIRFFRVGKDAYIFFSILSWFFMMLIGSALVAAILLRKESYDRRALHGAGASALAFALIAGGFAIGNIAARSAENLGHSPSGWALVRFPADTQSFPDPKSIKTQMRTPLGTDRADPNEWRQEADRALLAIGLPDWKYTRDRQLVVTVPDGTTLVFKPPFPANPKLRFGYRAWHPIDGFENPDGTIRPAGANDDYAIRYMITR